MEINIQEIGLYVWYFMGGVGVVIFLPPLLKGLWRAWRLPSRICDRLDELERQDRYRNTISTLTNQNVLTWSARVEKLEQARVHPGSRPNETELMLSGVTAMTAKEPSFTDRADMCAMPDGPLGAELKRRDAYIKHNDINSDALLWGYMTRESLAYIKEQQGSDFPTFRL